MTPAPPKTTMIAKNTTAVPRADRINISESSLFPCSELAAAQMAAKTKLIRSVGQIHWYPPNGPNIGGVKAYTRKALNRKLETIPIPIHIGLRLSAEGERS